MGGTTSLVWSLDQGIIFGSNKCFYCSVPSPPLPNLLDTHCWGMNDKLALPRSRLPCSINNYDGKLFSPEGIPMAHNILPSTMTIFLNEDRHFLPVGNIGINMHHDTSARRPVPSSSPLKMHTGRQGPLGLHLWLHRQPPALLRVHHRTHL
jgi:hypothetical protein